MKTNLLTTLVFLIVSILYSCSKESDDNYSAGNSQDNGTLTTTQRRIIISNCSGHAGCHSGARVAKAGSMQEATHLLRNSIDINRSLSVCDRNKLQSWFNGEVSR